MKIARDLLTEDGVIFISIGQDEIENMIKLCDEVFSHDNKCGIISRLMKSGGAKGTFFSPNIRYLFNFPLYDVLGTRLISSSGSYEYLICLVLIFRSETNIINNNKYY